MINQQLVDYIKNQMAQNIDQQKIKQNLLGAGWLENDIDQAMDSAMGRTIPQPPMVATTSGAIIPFPKFGQIWGEAIATLKSKF